MSAKIKKGAKRRPFFDNNYFLYVINNACHHGREDDG